MQGWQGATRAILATIILCTAFGLGRAEAEPSAETIARGSGTSVQEVNQVLKQYLQMRQMMKQYGALAAKGRLNGLGKLTGA